MQPAAYKAAVTILAKNSKVPIAPPNSPPENDIFMGLEKLRNSASFKEEAFQSNVVHKLPNVLLNMKYTPPPSTAPLVAIADTDNIVHIRIMNAINSIKHDPNTPAFPTTYPILRNNIELHMDNVTGANTPENVASPF